jgi:AsmA protein
MLDGDWSSDVCSSDLFMQAWAGKELVTGRTDMFLDLGGVGATDTEVLRSLEGVAGFKITDGSYSLSGSAEPAPAAKRPPPGATPQHPAPARRSGTPFSKASARLKVAQGVFQSDDFRLDGPGMVLTGKGRFSPAEDSISLNLTASMSGTPDVPIKVFGRLKDPEMEIPTGVLIGNAIMELLGLPLKPIKFFKDMLF